MKLIPWMIFVYCIFHTEARVPFNEESALKSEIGNGEVAQDDVKSNTQQSLRRKRHYNLPSSAWEQGMGRSFYDWDQDNRIRELEIRLQVQQELINSLLSRRNEPKVTVVPVYCPSSEKKNGTDFLVDRAGIDTEIERVWGSADDYAGPISLKPVRPNRPVSKQPPVEHGTIQAETSTKSPRSSPGICQAAILICCDKQGVEKRNCFTSFGCASVWDPRYTCNKNIVEKIMNDFIGLYGPASE